MRKEGGEGVTHEMEIIYTYPNGAQEFHCPQCGRRLVINWDDLEKRVITPGDESAQHTGGSGGLSISVGGVMEKDTYDFWNEEIGKLKGDV